MNLSDRIKGGLYGVAVGDALGGTTEFLTRKEIEQKHGYLTDIIGGGVWDLEPGEVTDDTMMTLCVAEGILSDPDDPMAAIGENFLAWFRTDPKDIGNIIRRVLSTFQGSWFEAAFLADQDLGQSAGNGTLMRCLPVGLCYSRLSDIERVSRMQSKMTHYDERCDEACIIYNRIVHRLLNNEGLHSAIEAEIKHTPYAYVLTENPQCEPSGYIVHTMNWAIHILTHSDSFSDVVQQAANLGGDTDTIAAIAGGIAGVHYGMEGIPRHYTDQIMIKDKLDLITDRIVTLRNS